MNVYVNHTSIPLPQRVEQREAQRRVKEAKREEWVTSVKYFQSWERQTQFHDKWDSAIVSECARQCKDGGIEKLPLDTRRRILRNVFDSEHDSYQLELNDNQPQQSDPTVSNGITAHFVQQTDGEVRSIPEKCDRYVSNYITWDNKNLADQQRLQRKNGAATLDNGMPPMPDHLRVPKPAKHLELKCRREKLRQLFLLEQEEYDNELRLGRNRIPSGSDVRITKNDLASKFSGHCSNRNAYLSGPVDSRRNEEHAHCSVFIPKASGGISANPTQVQTSTQVQDCVSGTSNGIFSDVNENPMPNSQNNSLEPKNKYSVFRFW